MKKLLSILLILVLISSLASCEKTNTSSDPLASNSANEIISNNFSHTESSSNTTNDNNANESTQSSIVDADTNHAGGTNTATNQSNTSSNPNSSNPSNQSGNTNTSSHTHVYSDATCTQPKKCSCGATQGKALNHYWTAATCTQPKTCSACNTTEGNPIDHVLSGNLCKWCQNAVAIDPNSFNPNVNYTCIKDVGIKTSQFDGREHHLFNLSSLHTDGFTSSFAGYIKSNPYPDWRQINGEYYAPTAEWNAATYGLMGYWIYEIVETELVITAEVFSENTMGEIAVIHCHVLSDGTLKVVSLSGASIHPNAGIHIGTIFYPEA